jgi:RNA polymerase sigma-70 factor (ECF subfamily)
MISKQINSLPDESVMARIKAGEGDALALLFRRYQRLVFSVAMKILRDLSEAEDMTQTVFMEIYKQAATYDAARGTPKAWILKIAYHYSLNRRQYLRVRSFCSAQELTEMQELLPLLHPFEMSFSEKKRLIEQALATLNSTQRKVLELAFFEGLSMSEIADRTGISFGNVRHVYYRSIGRLRSELKSAYETDANCARKEVSRAQA